MKRISIGLVLLAALSGCGGGDKPAAQPTASENPYCAEARVLAAKDETAQEALTRSLLGSGTPAVLQAAFTEFRIQFDKTRPLAPAEIKTDFEFFVPLFDAFAGELQRVKFDASKLPPSLVAQLQSPQVLSATTRIDDYNFKNCGIPRDEPQVGGPSDDKGTQSDLRQALLVVKEFFTDNGTYKARPDQFEQLEPLLRFGGIARADERLVGFLSTKDSIVLVKRSTTGTYFCIAQVKDSTTYGKGSTIADVDSVVKCDGISW